MQDLYEKLGEFLRDRLNSDEDPFADDDAGIEKTRRAGNTVEKKAVPKKSVERVPVPQELAEDFITLGLLPGEPLEECKAAWKRLLKKHHPDKNRKSEKSQKKAELTTIRITQAFRRIEHWFSTGETLRTT